MSEAAITVIRANVAGLGYVTAPLEAVSSAILDSLDAVIPYWRPSTTHSSVREAHGQLTTGHAYLSVGIHLPSLLDEYGRSGLFFWLSRIYLTEQQELVRRDMASTVAVIRQSSNWLHVPLQIIARSGGEIEILSRELEARINSLDLDWESTPTILPQAHSEVRRVSSQLPQATMQRTESRLPGAQKLRLLKTRLLLALFALAVLASTITWGMMREARRRSTHAIMVSASPRTGRPRRAAVVNLASSNSHLVTAQDSELRKVIARPDNLNIRSEPNTDAPILQVVHAGDRLTVVEERGEWKHVKFGVDISGWVSAQYVAPTE